MSMGLRMELPERTTSVMVSAARWAEGEGAVEEGNGDGC